MTLNRPASGTSEAPSAPRAAAFPPARGRRIAPIVLLLCVAAAPGSGVPPAEAAVSRSQQLKAESFDKLSRGIKAVRDGEPRLAVELLEDVARVALNSFRAHYYLGLAYKADRQYLRAVDPLSFALDLDPTHMQAHVDLGDCYLKRGDIGQALAEYQRAIEIQAAFAPAWDGLGRAAEAAGDDDKAVEQFTKAIELNPGFPDSSLNLGDLYLRGGRLREAVDLFLRAIAVRPNFAAAYNRLGVAYSRQRLGNEAIAALEKAADLERGNPWHPYTIGVIEEDLGYLARALHSYEAAIRLDENYLEAYVAKAGILRRLGRFEEAEFLLEAAADRPSEDVALLRSIRALREDYRRQRLTIDDIEARAEAGLASLSEVRSLASLRAGSGNWAGAARALESARRMLHAEAAREVEGGEGTTRPAGAAGDDPLPLSDRFRLGYYHLQAGAFVDAAESFAALRAEIPDSTSVLLNLGLSLEGKGQTRAAEQAYKDALARDPDDPIILAALGNVMVGEGRIDEAIAAYERALAAPVEFNVRPRVETILQALREAPAPGHEGSPARSAPDGGRR